MLFQTEIIHFIDTLCGTALQWQILPLAGMDILMKRMDN
jgi:hypothetical protein